MSQDLRDYKLCRVDDNRNEASKLSVTATVGPTCRGEIEGTRGVQVTLATSNGHSYARLSEPQIKDLIEALENRIDPEEDEFEATLFGVDRVTVLPDGTADGGPDMGLH